MTIDDLLEQLQKVKDKLDGDVVMQATLLLDSFSATNSQVFTDVFSSTVETVSIEENAIFDKHIHLYWQV